MSCSREAALSGVEEMRMVWCADVLDQHIQLSTLSVDHVCLTCLPASVLTDPLCASKFDSVGLFTVNHTVYGIWSKPLLHVWSGLCTLSSVSAIFSLVRITWTGLGGALLLLYDHATPQCRKADVRGCSSGTAWCLRTVPVTLVW